VRLHLRYLFAAAAPAVLVISASCSLILGTEPNVSLGVSLVQLEGGEVHIT